MKRVALALLLFAVAGCGAQAETSSADKFSDPDQKAWIQERIENIENTTDFSLKGRQTILERIVELELKAQKVTDPTEIAKRRSESLGTPGDGGKPEVLQGCVGRNITNRALTCVRNAESASEITDRCLQ